MDMSQTEVGNLGCTWGSWHTSVILSLRLVKWSEILFSKTFSRCTGSLLVVAATYSVTLSLLANVECIVVVQSAKNNSSGHRKWPVVQRQPKKRGTRSTCFTVNSSNCYTSRGAKVLSSNNNSIVAAIVSSKSRALVTICTEFNSAMFFFPIAPVTWHVKLNL